MTVRAFPAAVVHDLTSVVGGIAELPHADAAPLEVADSAGISTGVLVGIVASGVAFAGAGAVATRRSRRLVGEAALGQLGTQSLVHHGAA